MQLAASLRCKMHPQLWRSPHAARACSCGAGEENGYVQGTCKCGRHVGSSPASSRASRIGPPGGRFYACFHSSQTSGCSETIESERNPPETGWDGLGCFPAVVRWSQSVTSTCGGPAVGRARGLPKFYNKCCRFYNKLLQSVVTVVN